MSGGCDFHDTPNGVCVHCLGHELALARAESARLDVVPPYGSPTPGHIGWHKWKNGAELEWVCSRNCPHPDHDEEGR